MKVLIAILFMLGIGSSACAADVKWAHHADGSYSLNFSNTAMEVNPAAGGKIASFQLNGSEVLHANGATFWPSPQKDWGYWPPLAAIDSEPYTAELQDHDQVLVLTSNVDNRMGLQVKKALRANAANQSIVVTYTLINPSRQSISVAPWEITRAPGGGITFFPKASDFNHVQTNVGGPAELKPEEKDGIVWYQHTPAHKHEKFFRDGAEGWLAHSSGSLLLLKLYEDIQPKQFAPDEAEIGLYSFAEGVEIEPQGAYTELQSGEALDWTVVWALREIPNNVKCAVGSAALVEFARATARAVESSRIASVKHAAK